MDRPNSTTAGAAPAATAANEELDHQLRRFLAAEAAPTVKTTAEPSAEVMAEQALGAIFALLPAPEPRPDFAARVMARIEALPWQARRLSAPPADLAPSYRWPLAAALVLAGLATFFFLPAALLLLSRLGPGSLLEGTAGAWTFGIEVFARLAWVMQLARQLVAALVEVAASPPILLVALGSAALASVLSRWLWFLLEPARRSAHVAFR